MSRGQRFTFLGIAAIIAVVAVILLAGGGDDSEKTGSSAPTATPTATPTAIDGDATATPTATPKPKPKPVLLKAGSEKALNYEQGETVRFRVVNDEAEEVHVHGYDIKKELEPGKEETVSFKATIPGIFEIELEGSGTLLAQLKVVPRVPSHSHHIRSGRGINHLAVALPARPRAGCHKVVTKSTFPLRFARVPPSRHFRLDGSRVARLSRHARRCPHTPSR